VAMPPRPRAGPRSYASGLVGYCCRPLPLLRHTIYVDHCAGETKQPKQTYNTPCIIAATDPCPLKSEVDALHSISKGCSPHAPLPPRQSRDQ